MTIVACCKAELVSKKTTLEKIGHQALPINDLPKTMHMVNSYGALGPEQAKEFVVRRLELVRS